MTTIQELCAETNRWLHLRWQTAEHGYEMPTLSATVSYFRKQLEKAMEDKAGYDALKVIREERANNGLPETNASLHTLCCIDVKADVCLDGDDGWTLRIVTNIEEPSEASLATISMETAGIEDDGRRITAVKHIGAPDGQTYICDLLHDACAIQDSIGTDINERWLRQPYDVREQRPICPVCGADLGRQNSEWGGKETLSCPCCNWRSVRKYGYSGDIAEEEDFKYEVRFAVKKRELDDKLDEALRQLDKGADMLAEVFKKNLKGYDPKPAVKSRLPQLCKKLTDATGLSIVVGHF